MSIHLRPHHLLCILTYKGQGYTSAFVENFDQVIIELQQNSEILIIQGSDDICRGWLEDSSCHCHDQSIIERDTLALDCVSKVLGRSIDIGSLITLDQPMIQKLRHAYAYGKILRQACKDCQWYDLCNDTAVNAFQDVKL